MKKNIFFLLLFISTTTFAQQDTIYCESGLKYIRLKEGDGKKPATGQQVKIWYIGKLLNGEVFDELSKNSSFAFKVGDPTIIAGWNEGVKLMSKGEKGIFIIPSFLGYGTKGFKDPYEEKEYMIPPNATLIFEVELINIK